MITRKELSDFIIFCRKKYDLKIHDSVVNDFIVSHTSINKFESDIENRNKEHKVKCELSKVGCSYLIFNSARCEGCEA